MDKFPQIFNTPMLAHRCTIFLCYLDWEKDDQDRNPNVNKQKTSRWATELHWSWTSAVKWSKFTIVFFLLLRFWRQIVQVCWKPKTRNEFQPSLGSIRWLGSVQRPSLDNLVHDMTLHLHQHYHQEHYHDHQSWIQQHHNDY